ncbi:MAG TPA: hypothetical protein PK504_09855 [Ferruginibacter sp.]|nr:hypothetical protein [Ferruginibacter sp.]HRE63120.1 hypothetical protein [Ferruginibacter sp.]
MNGIKKSLGFVWMLLAPAIIYILVHGAIVNIGNGTKEINQPIPWIIIIGIFTPVAVGLFIFGWYCVKGAYKHLPENSNELYFNENQ